MKIGKKTDEQKKVIDNLNKFYNSREDIFFRDDIEMYNAKQNETEETGLRILTPKQILQRLPIALAQVKLVINQKVY